MHNKCWDLILSTFLLTHSMLSDMLEARESDESEREEKIIAHPRKKNCLWLMKPPQIRTNVRILIKKSFIFVFLSISRFLPLWMASGESRKRVRENRKESFLKEKNKLRDFISLDNINSQMCRAKNVQYSLLSATLFFRNEWRLRSGWKGDEK